MLDLQAIGESAREAEIKELSQQIMTEATFYGKNKYLLEAEGVLQGMVNVSVANGITSTNTINVFDNGFRKLEDLFEKCFGFRRVFINNGVGLLGIVSIAGTHNAYTFCKSFVYKTVTKAFNGEMFEVVDTANQPRGRLRSCIDLSMNITITMMYFEDHGENTMTGGEILATILHEIGHNFYDSAPRDIIEQIMLLVDSKSIAALMVFAVKKEVPGMIDYLYRLLPRSVQNGIGGFINLILTTCSPVIDTVIAATSIVDVIKRFHIVGSALGFVAARWAVKPVTPASVIKGIIDYDNEKFADAFVAAYGYGPENASGELKSNYFYVPFVTDVNAVTDFINAIYQFAKLPLFMTYLADCHPNNMGRLANNIDYMKAAGASIKNPVLRKDYENQLATMLKQREVVKSYQGVDYAKNMDKISAIIQDTIKINDPKELTSFLTSKTKWKNLDFDK